MPKLSPLGEWVETGSFIADGRFSGWCIPGTSLSQIGTAEANKKGMFSILSRIDCWHWSLTSPYRMDLELLTKSVKHLTSWFQTIELGFGQFPLFPWVSGSKLSIVLFFLTNHMLTSIPWQRSDCHMFAVDSVN